MKKNQLLLLILLLSGTSLFAQQRTITGHVRKDNNEPIANATVAVKNTSTASQTDSAGHFSLSLSANATTLIVSYVGFKTEEVSIGNRSDISITLNPSSATLQDVVVTALGFETKKEKLATVLQYLMQKYWTKTVIFIRIIYALQRQQISIF